MKLYNFLFLFLSLSFCSCSDNDNKDEETPAQFEFFVNGTAADVGNFTKAEKTLHHIHLGTDATDTPFLVSFDENGRFGKVVYKYHEPLTSEIKTFTSYANYSSNFFNFNMASYDEVNKRVKVTFDGYIYSNPLDLNSESKFVSGSFDLPFEEYIPTFTNIISEATIDGNYWRATNKYQTNFGSNITLHTLRDDDYKIMVSFSDNYPIPTLSATYNFTPDSPTNKVQIAKFDLATSSYTFYDCTGTMTVNKWNLVVQGNYTLTGVNPSNPNDVITIQDGNYKLIFKH